MYDFFYTRYCLHRRAYQHRVNKAIEIMIRDALSKVLDIKIEGFEKTLMESIDDMAAYTKLTDCLLQRIMNDEINNSSSTDHDLKEAKEILERIFSRDLYVFLGESLVVKSKRKGEQKKKLAEHLRLCPEDFEIEIKLISQKKIERKKKLAEQLSLTPEDFEIEVKRISQKKNEWKMQLAEPLRLKPVDFETVTTKQTGQEEVEEQEEEQEQEQELTPKDFEIAVKLISQKKKEWKKKLAEHLRLKPEDFGIEIKLISQKKKEWKKKLAEHLRMTPEDFEIEDVTINYGMGEKNPIEEMYFYKKSDSDSDSESKKSKKMKKSKKIKKAVKLPKEQVSHLLPDTFSETVIRVYCKKTLQPDERKQLMNWCKENIFKTLQK